MELYDIGQQLATNTYPGRGIIIGRNDQSIYCAYFIMGRSENSRNRVFVPKDGGIVTRAYDESKVTDPSLIIYAPVRTLGDRVIITNGDQTDTIATFYENGKTFEQALETRTYEPDAPNFTPRISAVIERNSSGFTYKMSILKHSGNPEGEAARLFWTYERPASGQGRLIHTYQSDGDPLPSFDGEPEKVAIYGSIDEFTNLIWVNLNAANKVSLFTRTIDIKTGAEQTRIINKHV